MTINEKITVLTNVAEELNENELKKAQSLDSDVLERFEQARNHVRDAAAMLRDALKKIRRIKEQGEKVIVFDADLQRHYTAEVWVFDTVDSLRGSTAWGAEAVRLGAQLGVTYEEGEAVARVVFTSPERRDEDYSWQDHGIPLSLQEHLKIDEQRRFAPCWLPVWMLRKIAEDGEYVLNRNGGQIQIHLKPWSKDPQDLDWVLDNLKINKNN